jgi:hypothetical protein
MEGCLSLVCSLSSNLWKLHSPRCHPGKGCVEKNKEMIGGPPARCSNWH